MFVHIVRWLALAASCLASFPSLAIEFQLKAPGFTVRIPDVPQFDLGPHPNAARQSTARLLGSMGGLSLSVLAPTADAGTTPAQCASWLAGNVLSRFSPDLASLQILKAGENAYVLVFPFPITPVEQLKAFVVSGNGKGHCIEVHISRIGATEAERQQWLSGFRNVQVSAE